MNSEKLKPINESPSYDVLLKSRDLSKAANDRLMKVMVDESIVCMNLDKILIHNKTM